MFPVCSVLFPGARIKKTGGKKMRRNTQFLCEISPFEYNAGFVLFGKHQNKDPKIELMKSLYKTHMYMKNTFKESLWKQFGASIDMLENAITMCPDELWDTEEKFWYSVYHCLFFLDYYLTVDPATYSSPEPFTNSEFEGRMPERTYTKDELLNYLQVNREKCHTLLLNFTDEIANSRWINPYRNYSVFEMLLYNMRHVQHHAAQLNKFLREKINNAPSWVVQTKNDL